MTDTQTAEKAGLLALLDRLKALALSEGFDAALDEAEDLRQKLAADRFEIVVLGQFKRGKSSLINALVGADVLPTGSVPLTSVMTVVRHSDKPGARVVFRKKDALEVSLDQLPLFITEKGNPKNQKAVVRVEAAVDSPFLASGDVLVDTPGVGSTHAHNTQAAYDALPRADAVLYVLSVDPPVGEEDLKFLVSIRQHVSKIFFVLNKRDYLPDKEFEENRAFTEQILKETLQVESVALFPVSARWAREGKENSGVPDLALHLKEFLRTGKGRQVLDRTARRAEEAARGALALVELEHRAYTGKSADLEAKAWALSSYINNVFMEGA
jgi:GTPase Era involved in 16S rRNA processing